MFNAANEREVSLFLAEKPLFADPEMIELCMDAHSKHRESQCGEILRTGTGDIRVDSEEDRIGVVVTIIVFVLIFGVVVIAHELGHFLIAN